jgi:shikimate kinase
MNIILTGFMGTGKTSVGKRLARRLGWQFVDIDSLIVASAKESVVNLFAEHGEAVFRRLEQRAIRRVVRGDEQVIATGGGAFVNPTNRSLLRTVGPVICLTAKPSTILQRVGPTAARRPMLTPPSAGQGEGAVRSRIERLLQQRAPAYAKADLRIATDGASVEEAVERIWDAIGPGESKSWHYLLTHNDRLMQRYGGQYIAVLDDRIVGTGPTQLRAYQAIPKPVAARCEVAIFYIPLREESPAAL